MGNAEEMASYYGIIIPDRKFHISPLCPALRTIGNWKQGTITEYPKETDAILKGHLQRCPICFNMYRFQVRVEDQDYEYLLDKYDVRVLLKMADLQRRGGTIAATAMESDASMTAQEINDTFKRLRKMRLVGAAEFLGAKVRRGKRKFTPQGIAVVLAYENKLYHAPMEDDAELGREKINNRLF